jgi:hypothetical protein
LPGYQCFGLVPCGNTVPVAGALTAVDRRLGPSQSGPLGQPGPVTFLGEPGSDSARLRVTIKLNQGDQTELAPFGSHPTLSITASAGHSLVPLCTPLVVRLGLTVSARTEQCRVCVASGGGGDCKVASVLNICFCVTRSYSPYRGRAATTRPEKRPFEVTRQPRGHSGRQLFVTQSNMLQVLATSQLTSRPLPTRSRTNLRAARRFLDVRGEWRRKGLFKELHRGTVAAKVPVTIMWPM